MGLIDEFKRWNATDYGDPRGTSIEYFIDGKLKRIEYKINITTALDQIESVVSCLNFDQMEHKPLYNKEIILFESSAEGCFSHVGKQKGRPTRINLDPNSGCLDVVTVKHEVMHSLGYPHEHQRTDRDSFVKILSNKKY